MFQNEKYNFSVYRNNVKKAAERMRLLGEIGHSAEQKDIKDRIYRIDSG